MNPAVQFALDYSKQNPLPSWAKAADNIYDALKNQYNEERNGTGFPHYPIVAKQGPQVSVLTTGSPEPLSVRQTKDTTVQFTYTAESPEFNTQGEPRVYVDHPLQYFGWTLTHHPDQAFALLWGYARQAVGWVVWNYTDFFQQLQAWDGTWFGLVGHMGLLWRGMVVALLTMGLIEIAPLLEALASWLRIAFDVIRTVFHLAGEALDELWYLLQRLWTDLTHLW